MSRPCHALTPEEAFQRLNSSAVGLSHAEAQRRLSEYGPNELRKEKQASWVKIFLRQFADVLMLILLIATGLSIAIGEYIDAMVVIAIVSATAILGFVQEYRSEKAVEALKRMASPTAMVLRDGKEVKIPATDIVPGDVILLYAGDKVPADGRLFKTFNLKVDEASLTGESSPVSKNVEVISEDVSLNDRRNMVFTGTVVVYGRGTAVATSTGMDTEFGNIARMVQTAKQEETPLEKRTQSVGKWIGILSVTICVGVAVIGMVEGLEIIDMLLWGVSLAVAAVPEALPAIVTGALAIGMYRMAKVNTIVRKLPAVETLGCASVICSDKTGTMTKGEMTVQRICVGDEVVKVTGVGYEPEGSFLVGNQKIGPKNERLGLLLKVGVLCNDAKLEKDPDLGRWVVRGDPTEGALLVAAAKTGLWKDDIEKQHPRIGEIPFSSETKRMTTVHAVAGGTKMAYMKGAPEIVLEKCAKVVLPDGKVTELTEDDRISILKMNEAMAKQALRNLGLAFRELPERVNTFDETIENDFVFAGIMGMTDPPREEVKEAVYTCKKAGIDVVMVTGDHKLTAIAVAKQLNLLGENDFEGKVLTGEELQKLSDEQLREIAQNVVVYARVSPEHKTRIVKAWKANGHVVAMTGDGVNDAPALKMADIGVAMGITGTEVTKEAGDMVLTDDNFASIVKAAREGREIYDNIKKYLTYLMRCNIMEILVMFIAVVSVPFLARAYGATDAATISGATVALTAVQLLWVNLTTDGLPAIALGVDPGDPDIMERKPRDPNESIFTRDVKAYLSLVPILMTALLLFGYFYYQPWLPPTLDATGKIIYDPLLEARTQLLTSMILMELANAISARSLKYPVWKVGAFKNRFLWYAVGSSFILQLFILYTPMVNRIFNVTVPELLDWAFAVLFAAITFTTLETAKWVMSRRRNRQTA